MNPHFSKVGLITTAIFLSACTQEPTVSVDPSGQKQPSSTPSSITPIPTTTTTQPNSQTTDSGSIAKEPGNSSGDATVNVAPIEVKPPAVTEYATSRSESSSTTTGWPATNIYDQNFGTVWSSATHSSAAATEWLAYWWSEGLQTVNFVKVRPRFAATAGGVRALGFPTQFRVNISDGSQWIEVASYSNFPVPRNDDWIILPLPGPYRANGIQIVAGLLGSDDTTNFAFQLAEAKAGFSEGFSKFTWVHNDLSALPRANHVGGVGSGPFDPNKLSNWNFDERGVVLAPNPGLLRNIYAPQAVRSDGTWFVYFGGWDGVMAGNDAIHLTTTSDFFSFSPHAQVLSNGAFVHANNCSVIKVAPGNWKMFFTAGSANLINKTGYANSSDGRTWSPNPPTASQLIQLNGYPNGTAGDFNGGNAIFKDANGKWHLYFQDFSSNASKVQGVLHATSDDSQSFTYVGQALTEFRVPQDLKAFQFNGKPYYLGLFHLNTDRIWATVSTDTTNLGPDRELFKNAGAEDRYIVAAGLVQDGNRVHGVLYGASPVSSLDQNRIFARWLQKKVIFQNARVRWGDVERGFGPDALRLYQAEDTSIETGNFYVYDTDGTTLLFISPPVTIRPGDVWNYSGP